MQISNIETITELSQLNGRVYIYLPTSDLAEQFMLTAEAEGFTFEDGARVTKRDAGSIMAVNPNHTINYVGTNGMIAFGSGVQSVGGMELLRYVCRKGNTAIFFEKYRKSAIY